MQREEDGDNEARDNDLDLEERCPVGEVSIIIGGPLILVIMF